MRVFSWRVWLPLMVLAALFLGACADDDDPTTSDGTSEATTEADGSGTAAPSGSSSDEGQVLNVNLSGEATTLDPQRATDTNSIAILHNIYSGLLRLDENLELVPGVAEEIPSTENGGISEDGLTYTFHLKEGLKWSDGEPLVAQQFVDGMKHLFEPGSGNYYVDFYRVIAAGGANQEVVDALAAGVEGAELEALEQKVADQIEVSAPDDRTVVYKLHTPSPVFNLLAALWPMFPARADIIEQYGDQWTEAGNMVSNGPFKLEEWNHNENIVLVRNEFWHGEAPPLARINVDMIDDRSVAFLAYQEGELDVTTLGPAELVQVRGTDLEDEFRTVNELVTIGVYFNAEDPITSDPKVRQALAGSLDRAELANVVLEGAVVPAYGWVPPGMPGHDPEVGLQYKDAVEESQALLEEAGYPGGEGLTITVLSTQSDTSALQNEWLQQQWESNLGITVEIRALEDATYFEERNAGNFQVVSGGWGADYPDPQNWMPLFVSGAGLNAGNFSNAEYDALVNEAATELDNDRRIELYLQAQEILIDQAGFAPLYYRSRNVLVKPWVKDLYLTANDSAIPGARALWQVSVEGRE